MDIIFLHGLEVDCVIGVWEWERRITQKIVIDLDMGWDITKAASSDDLSDTLSYKDVAKRVSAHVQNVKANLVERLAEDIANILLGEFGCLSVDTCIDDSGANWYYCVDRYRVW